MPQRVALTSDCWKAFNGFHYIVVTAYIIDSDRLLNKRIIDFKKFSFSHNGSNLSQIIMKVVREFRLESKFFSISVDNASNNIVTLELLKNYSRSILNEFFSYSLCMSHY